MSNKLQGYDADQIETHKKQLLIGAAMGNDHDMLSFRIISYLQSRIDPTKRPYKRKKPLLLTTEAIKIDSLTKLIKVTGVK